MIEARVMVMANDSLDSASDADNWKFKNLPREHEEIAGYTDGLIGIYRIVSVVHFPLGDHSYPETVLYVKWVGSEEQFLSTFG